MNLRGVVLRSFPAPAMAVAFALLSSGSAFAQSIDQNLWVTNGTVNAVVEAGGTMADTSHPLEVLGFAGNPIRVESEQNITASAGPGGTISPSGEVLVPEGSNQDFVITFDPGYHIADVLVDGSSVGPVAYYNFTNVVASHTITASFALNVYTITASAGSNGSIAPSGAVPVTHGSDQAFTISPDAGYHIADVLVDGSPVGPVANYNFSNVVATHTIAASFALNVYTITASAGSNGSIAPSGAVPVTHGSDQAFTISPDAGYHIADVLVDGSSVGPVANYNFSNVVATHTIAASFALNVYTITASAGSNGSIAPSGAVPVTHGSDQAFTISPDAGYHIADVLVDGLSVGGVAAYTFFQLGADHTIAATFINTPAVSGIQPSGAGVSGSVSVTISGVGFQGGATVKLTRLGWSEVVGSQVTIASDGRSLTAVFELIGSAQGVWDLVVTNPDLSAAMLPGGFIIAEGLPHQLGVNVLGPALMRPNRRKAFDIVLENLGNSDVLAVPLWISRIPANATVELDFALTSPPRAGGEPDWSLAPLTLDGPGGKYLALVIPRLPPGTTVRRIYLTVPNPVTSFTLDAALTPPWADGAVFRDCLSGGGITAPACMGAQLTAINAYLAATPGIQALGGIGLWAKIAWQCEGAASLPAALVKAEQVLDFMLQPVEGASTPTGCVVALTPRWQDRHPVAIVTSVDPNAKFGAGGVGPNRQIGSAQILPYSIRFENLENATAPAQEVVVIDALDPVTLDLNTVILSEIKFGRRANGLPWTVEPPPGPSSYTTDVNLSPELPLIVRVSVNLDRATGLMGWSMISIDPSTGLPPLNPLVGFLPPNLTPPEGEGSVLFTVLPKPGLPGGTAIRNRATIDFDGASQQTPDWSNTLDTTAPESQVLSLGALQDSASFTVRWQAIGAPPDLHDFSVYVSQNGGAFRPWRLHTTATADTIGAPVGGTYAFYSLARDSSGNLEPVPAAPYVQTYSRVAVEAGARPRLALEGAVPNPATSEARVWFTLPNRERATLEVMDVAGRRVLRREVGAMGPGRHSVDVSGSVGRPGLYFLRLAQSGQTLRARMAVIR